MECGKQNAPAEAAAGFQVTGAGSLDILAPRSSIHQLPDFAGDHLTLADSSTLPHFVFMTEFLPRYFGWPDLFAGCEKLRTWWELMAKDETAQKVRRK
jgi:hypothetical protein